MMWRNYTQDNQPNPGQMILVIGRDKREDVVPLKYFKRFQSVAQYHGSGKIVLKELVYPWDTEITHWMPLPTYPEDSKWFGFVNFFKNLFRKKK